MSKVVINSSVIIALSATGHLDKLKKIFNEILITKAVHDEICVRGRGLIGEHELTGAIKNNLITVKEAKNRILVNALLDPLAMGEAETITLATEEKVDYIVLDDKLARKRAKAMKLNVIGTLKILRLMYESKLIDKSETMKAMEKLRETGFRISEDIIGRALKEL